jgi:hypothetical protein
VADIVLSAQARAVEVWQQLLRAHEADATHARACKMSRWQPAKNISVVEGTICMKNTVHVAHTRLDYRVSWFCKKNGAGYWRIRTRAGGSDTVVDNGRHAVNRRLRLVGAAL